jgi:hypothetical protein
MILPAEKHPEHPDRLRFVEEIARINRRLTEGE